MGIQLPGHLHGVMGMMGAQFPVTDEDALEADAAQWTQIATLCRREKADLAGAVSYVAGANSGPAAEAFAAYMGGESNLAGAEALAAAADRVASGCRRVAGAVRNLKTAVIAEAAGAYRVLQLAQGPDGAVYQPILDSVLNQAGARCRTLDAQTAQAVEG